MLEGVGDFLRDRELEEVDVAIMFYVTVVRGGEARPGIALALLGPRVRLGIRGMCRHWLKERGRRFTIAVEEAL